MKLSGTSYPKGFLCGVYGLFTNHRTKEHPMFTIHGYTESIESRKEKAKDVIPLTDESSGQVLQNKLGRDAKRS